MEKTSII